MRDFKVFQEAVHRQFESMVKDNDNLFLTDVDKDELWNTYLGSFPPGTDLIHKERTQHDCVCCKQFVRPCANIVSVKGDEVTSIWDVRTGDPAYDAVAAELSKRVKSAPIVNIFVGEAKRVGTPQTKSMLETGRVFNWNHFYIDIPKKLMKAAGKSVESIQGNYRTTKEVFKRGLDELSLDAAETILELMNQGSLYRGAEFKDGIKGFIKTKKEYAKIKTDALRDIYCWVNAYNSPISRIRNSAIGTLLINISEGMDLDKAVTAYEKVVAPSNYKRPKAIFTKQMVEGAQKTLVELGLENSLGRRFAVLEDITVNNVIWANRDAKSAMSGNVFDQLKHEASSKVNPKALSKVEEISIEEFIEKVLPNVSSVEALFERKHEPNLVSLIAPTAVEGKSIFKWDNNFCWTYNGNIADSMKEQVKLKGGNVTGVLRFSIMWNEKGDNLSDLDAHCIEPNGNEIYFPNKGRQHNSSGRLDVDIVSPRGVAVENIAYSTLNKMPKGVYRFFVQCYRRNGSPKSGFSAEIEFDGEIYNFVHADPLHSGQKVDVAKVEVDSKGNMKLLTDLKSDVSTYKVWDADVNGWNKVAVICHSPNYWNNNAVGNKHYMFMLKDCINPDTPRGFFNEYLKNELNDHRRVFEVLGDKMKVQESDKQLSGLGFSSTQRNDLTVRVTGAFTRTLKIKF